MKFNKLKKLFRNIFFLEILFKLILLYYLKLEILLKCLNKVTALLIH